MTPPERHVAVLRRRYLDALLAGEKRVESRLSLARVAPFERVRAGDLVYLKAPGAPVEAVAAVEAARFYEIDGPAGVAALRDRFNHLIGAPPDYWRAKRLARYATLLWLDPPRPLEPRDAPPAVPPLFGRGWLALGPAPARRSA